MSPKRILNIDLSYFPKCTEALTRTFSKVKINLHLFLLSTGNVKRLGLLVSKARRFNST